MNARSGERESSALPCPACGDSRPRREWRRVLRFVRGAKGIPPVMILRHRPCNEIAYFLVE